jgi:hypothetical protein
MIETCERCGNQSAKLERCDYCGRKICYSCIKSSKRKKVGRLYICKDCWGNIQKRKKFKAYSYRQE